MSDLAPWRKADIIYVRWRHQMEIFSALLALCEGNSPVAGNFPSQRPVTLMFSLIGAWTYGWAYHWDAGDLRLHRAHYDVFIMKWILKYWDLNVKVVYGSSTHWSKNTICTSSSVWRGRYLILLSFHYLSDRGIWIRLDYERIIEPLPK